ncbi:hypothetical protein EDD21DRAFT_1235 [Dissophora ornata]|nr:hypothetical protein EDD21DRAFT_1235 [Dissophora ornata]
MSTLTSFDALHEPPPQPEDPPENVLSKLFQRVKSTLSTQGGPSNTFVASTSTSSQGGATGAGMDSHTAGNNSSSASSYPPPIVVSSTDPSIGSWTAASDGDNSNNNTDNNGINARNGSSSSSTSSMKSGTQSGLSLPMTVEDNSNSNNNDRTIIAKRHHYYGSTSAPKRASSLFKVSTMDHSIVQDDDTASLASLAPPVVSLSPVFGGQQTLNDGSLNVSPGALSAGAPDNRVVDHTRLSTGKRAKASYT